MQIESSFLRERDEILARNEEEVKQLFNSQKMLEQEYMDKRAKKEDSYTTELENLRTQDAND